MTTGEKDTAIFAESAAALKGKNMIAVTSGCRGSGKTWFAVTLAHALSLFKQKVILFDADSGLNNARTQLGLSPKKDLDSVIYGCQTLNQVVFPYDKGRFDIIAGTPGSSGLMTMSVGRLQILGDDLNILAQNYDKAILDISSGLTNPEKVLAGMSGEVIIVCLDTPQSVTETYALIKAFATRYPKAGVNLVINQVNTIEDGLRTYEMITKACREFLKVTLPLLGVVRQDTRVRDSIRNQSTIISRYPQSEAALDVMAIANRILKNERFC
ncbi:MAG: AAA family ATPase [bacterium]|nr:AAA family ATPase [bacterium]MDY2830157.1 AAA family ATPase [Alphaproteobacteria bacterium]